MAMIRTHVQVEGEEPVRLLISARSIEDVIYREELEELGSDDKGIDVMTTLTRTQPPGWNGHSRRVDREMLEETAWPPADQPDCYVCGPTTFVEAVASTLVDIGHEPQRIRTERFGPTGG
jgi:ferredoxin-NADP reductase